MESNSKPKNKFIDVVWNKGLLRIYRFVRNIFIPYDIEIDKNIIVKTPFSFFPFILIVLIYLTYISAVKTHFSIPFIWERVTGLGNTPYVMRPLTAIEYFMQTYFPVDWSVIPELTNPLIETIQMAFVGSLIGSALALPAAVLASSNIVKSNYVLVPVRLFLSFLRTLPIIIYASLFVFIVGFGAFPGIMAIIVFTFSIVAKMLFERIETVDMGPYEAIESTGATKVQAFTTAIMPQILPSFYSMSLYAFEINVRYAAILGYVGAGGIGDYLNKTMDANIAQETHGVLVVLLFIWIVVIIIEMTSKFLRRRFA